MLVKFKIKGLTNVPAFQEYIKGKAGDGFVYRNLGNRMELDIVRMFVFDLANKLEDAHMAGKIGSDFKVSNSPYFIGQTPAFWKWLSDRWRDYVEVEQVSEMKDRFSEAFENPINEQETGDIVWYQSPSGQSRRGRVLELNQLEGYMVVSDITSGAEYAVAIGDASSQMPIHEDIFKPATHTDLQQREQERPPLTMDDLDEITVVRDLYNINKGSLEREVSDDEWIAIVSQMLKQSGHTLGELNTLSNEVLSLLMSLDDASMSIKRTNKRQIREGSEKKKSFTSEESKKLAEDQGYTGNMQEFVWGMDIELEHGTITPDTNVTDDDPTKTAKIALAHLNEIPDYYTRLRALEKAGKAAKKG
jgi:hypothetical protein